MTSFDENVSMFYEDNGVDITSNYFDRNFY